MSIPHPFPYQGSKRKLAGQILSYFPQKINILYEPFCGSAAITIASAYHCKAARFAINDINSPLIKLWQSIIENPVEIATQYADHWQAQLGHEKEYYYQVRDIFNQSHQPADFLYLLARCVKASVRYNADGQFNQSPDNRRKGMRPVKMQELIMATSHLLKGKVQIFAKDYREVLAMATSQDLIYLDPPYQGVGGRNPRYLESLPFDEFVKSLENLNSRGIPYIVSYDGRTGQQNYGETLPQSLDLKRIEIEVGRSSQATLLGRNQVTIESLYLSPHLTSFDNCQFTQLTLESLL